MLSHFKYYILFSGLIVLEIALTSCGQAGPLYLPDPNTHSLTTIHS